MPLIYFSFANTPKLSLEMNQCICDVCNSVYFDLLDFLPLIVLLWSHLRFMLSQIYRQWLIDFWINLFSVSRIPLRLIKFNFIIAEYLSLHWEIFRIIVPNKMAKRALVIIILKVRFIRWLWLHLATTLFIIDLYN